MSNVDILSAWLKRQGLEGVNRPQFTESHFAPYAKAIGSLLLAWNDMHERLSTLFVSAMGAAAFAKSFALWHETRTDITKRQLLRTAIANLGAKEIGERKKLVEEVNWILDQAKSLEGYRDDSAHTPLRYGSDADELWLSELILAPDILEITAESVRPNTAFSNPRAVRIKRTKPDLLIELRYARERILVLRDYAFAIEHAWTNAHVPWPDRPRLPDRKPNRRSKGQAARQRKK